MPLPAGAAGRTGTEGAAAGFAGIGLNAATLGVSSGAAEGAGAA